MSSNERIPLCCPLHSYCKKCSSYQGMVRRIAAHKAFFLNNQDEMWRFVANCPHKIEDAFWTGAIGEKDWLRYLTCETFSKWFWKERRKEVTIQRQGKDI